MNSVPGDWNGGLREVRLLAELPQRSAFARPAIYSAYSNRLNISDRGLTREQAVHAVLTELGIKGLRMQLSSVHRLTHGQAVDLARVTDPIAKRILAAMDERDREVGEGKPTSGEALDTDEEDLEAIREGLEQSHAGEGRLVSEFLAEFESKHFGAES